MRILRETEAGCLKSVYPDLNILLDDLAVAYKKLLEGLYEVGCRYVQFEGVKSMLTDEAARLNNRVLRERPEGLFVAFHAATDMLIRLHGADAYFLNYDCGICDRSRLLWFVHEREAVFGFVLSYYPDEEELDELQAKMEEVLNYIPMKHLTLCLPDADNFSLNVAYYYVDDVLAYDQTTRNNVLQYALENRFPDRVAGIDQ